MENHHFLMGKSTINGHFQELFVGSPEGISGGFQVTQHRQEEEEDAVEDAVEVEGGPRIWTGTG